jgi:hypothetical protein
VSKFFYGLIEGFYGRQWSWDTRTAYADFLAQQNFDCYIYAPKGDAFLRSRWRENHDGETWQQLTRLVAVYHDAGLRFGIGLSPIGLNRHYSDDDKAALIKKVQQLNTLNADVLCILFDDTEGDIADMAQRQVTIAKDIMAHSSAGHFIVCPSYYSFDPVLEKVFGPMPKNYLLDFAQGLPAEVDIFWTGNQVISPQYTAHDIKDIRQIIQRKPVLWDNYPVNDGKKTSAFLHLRPYQNRPWQLSELTSGHLVNPMNQAMLSQLVLMSLKALYLSRDQYNPDKVLLEVLGSLADEKLAACIKDDVSLFQDVGLNALTDLQKKQLLVRYQSFDHIAASEIVDWLSGGFEFDAACLTD